MPDKLRDFLEQKKKEATEESAKVDWAARKQMWLDAVSRLYDDVSCWIADAGGQAPKRQELQRVEERIGPYLVPSLSINVGSDVVIFDPIGTLVIGGDGRVDVFAGSRREKVVHLILDRAKGWQIGIKAPRPRLLPFDREAFTQMLQELVA